MALTGARHDQGYCRYDPMGWECVEDAAWGNQFMVRRRPGLSQGR